MFVEVHELEGKPGETEVGCSPNPPKSKFFSVGGIYRWEDWKRDDSLVNVDGAEAYVCFSMGSRLA